MRHIEGGDAPRVLPLVDPLADRTHEQAGVEPGVVPDHEEGQDVIAITLVQGSDQFSPRLLPPDAEPPLELIEDDQEATAARESLPRAKGRERLGQAVGLGGEREPSPQPPQEDGLGLVLARLDVDRDNPTREPRQQARPEQRGLPAAGRAVEQAQPEGDSVRSVNPLQPEVDAVGHPITVAGTGQQLGEEVGVGCVVGSKSPRHDRDRLRLGALLARHRVDWSETPRGQRGRCPRRGPPEWDEPAEALGRGTPRR